MGTLTSWAFATLRHVAHAWLLLVPIAAMGTLTLADRCYCWTHGTPAVAASATPTMGSMTSVDRCYCWTRGTRAVAASTHSSDEHRHQWTIATTGHVAHTQLLLAPTAVMGTLTSVDRCYCWTHGTHTVAVSAHSSDGHLTSVDHCYCWTRGTRTVLLVRTAAMGHLTSADHCYCFAHSMRAVATSPTVATDVLTLVTHHHWHPQ
jgi:hypothetical protein